ncbi:hypothetical protein [Nocardia cyriacigeorgica]|uniref:Uncharacterized protein n=1 Tax=Nocardia cyriacigeorgica TaxID=135487 RepID=A0A6P1DF92_9NOCA|nr:hypothetical protein [Nocardia cyriacigeorgica]NEW47263.1 hypothetical protein [Nocardia cyriacigeorgica]
MSGSIAMLGPTDVRPQPRWMTLAAVTTFATFFAAGSWFLAWCWAWTETTGDRCRNRRHGFLHRCQIRSHRASIYDLWGLMCMGIGVILAIPMVRLVIDGWELPI